MITWASHIIRDTAHASWSARILHVRSSHELDARRAANSSRRPESRAFSGFCFRRWTDSVHVACTYVQDYKFSRVPYANGNRQVSFKKLEDVLTKTKQDIEFVQRNLHLI